MTNTGQMPTQALESGLGSSWSPGFWSGKRAWTSDVYVPLASRTPCPVHPKETRTEPLWTWDPGQVCLLPWSKGHTDWSLSSDSSVFCPGRVPQGIPPHTFSHRQTASGEVPCPSAFFGGTATLTIFSINCKQMSANQLLSNVSFLTLFFNLKLQSKFLFSPNSESLFFSWHFILP